MSEINTEYLQKCIDTLEKSYKMLQGAETERWMKYRDNRNNIAHDYGQAFAEETLILMGSFLADAKSLKEVIDNA